MTTLYFSDNIVEQCDYQLKKKNNIFFIYNKIKFYLDQLTTALLVPSQ